MRAPLFTLDKSVKVDDLANYMFLVIGQTRAVQSSLFELTSSKKHIASYFEEISALVSQTENNLEQLSQMADELNSRKIEEVQS